MRSRVRRVMGDNAQKRRSESNDSTVPDDVWQALRQEAPRVPDDVRREITEVLRQAGKERR